MFNCEQCHNTFGPGVAETKSTVVSRKVTYEPQYMFKGRLYKKQELYEVLLSFNDWELKRALEEIDCVDSGGEGYEIVREMTICPVCAGTATLSSFELYDPRLGVPIPMSSRRAKEFSHYRPR